MGWRAGSNVFSPYDVLCLFPDPTHRKAFIGGSQVKVHLEESNLLHAAVLFWPIVSSKTVRIESFRETSMNDSETSQKKKKWGDKVLSWGALQGERRGDSPE